MKLFETFREFRVLVFRYRATNENAELGENKIQVIIWLRESVKKYQSKFRDNS